MTKSQAERYARTLRIMASRAHAYLYSGQAERAGCKDEMDAAHRALCKAFNAVERKFGV